MIQQNMGLVGGLLVTRADAATADGRPNDTDMEILSLFHVSSLQTNILILIVYESRSCDRTT